MRYKDILEKMLIKVSTDMKRWVPGYVFRQAPFKLIPLGFSIQTKAEERLFPKTIQEAGLKSFLNKPFGGQNYIITGYLDDAKALYMAAYLMEAHVKKGGKNPVWLQLHKNTEIVSRPSLIVISNLTTESTQKRFEKCRDLLHTYWNVPCIVVGCGMDPIRFGSWKLHIPVNKMLYFKSGLDTETLEIE